MTHGAFSGRYGKVIKDDHIFCLYVLRLSDGKDTDYLREQEVLKIDGKFTEEQWNAFGVSGLTVDHFIQQSGGSYFKPTDASGLKWQCAGDEKPEKGVELTNTELANACKSRNIKGQFNEEDWQRFGIDDLRMEHFIERSDGGYARPSLATGRKWKLSEPNKPEEGVELSNAALADALKEKTEFSAEEWAAFGIAALHLDHFIKSGNSFYSPFEVPEGFLPKIDVARAARFSLLTSRGRSSLARKAASPQSNSNTQAPVQRQ